MKANRLRTGWILLRTALITLDICTKALVFSWFGKLTRQRVDDFARNWTKRLFRVINLTCTVHNPHHINLEDGKSYLIMVNHCSHYDIPLSLAALPGSIRMIAKKELSRIPVFGIALKKAEFQFIDRKNRKQAIRDLAVAKEKMQSGIVLWIAPEGTRSLDGELGPFKKGGFITAIQAKAHIIPMTIRGSARILPPKTWDFHINESVDIDIHEPVDAGNYNLKQIDELMTVVKEKINQPLT